MLELYDEQYDPDAAPIRFDDLSYDYQRAYFLYTKISHHLIIAPSGAIMGLDIQAIHVSFSIYNVSKPKQAILCDKMLEIQNIITKITAPKEEEDNGK